MKQILQNLKTGDTDLVDLPIPALKRGCILTRSSVTLVSAGTERMLVEFGKASFLDKARQQPEKVKQVLEKFRTDGLFPTIDAVRTRLDYPVALGYSNVGVVAEVSAGALGFEVGDRLVSNGPHAEMVVVNSNLCARIPDDVDNETAAFTVLASIGLQGIRLAKPTLGERVVVTGAGLIGLLTVQLLKAQGCRVMAIDIDESKLALAKQFGAEVCNPGTGADPVAAGMAFSCGNGVDAVIITASTQSSDPVSQAAQMSRKRGRIVLVGVTGLELNRSDFYEKELTFQVSCSYGPGRYDSEYEEKGHDYPIGHVRWTEQRNFEAVLELMAAGKLDVKPLISHRFAFEDSPKAYDVLSTDRSALGILLQYTSANDQRDVKQVVLGTDVPVDLKSTGSPVVGFIGAGNYASRTLIPAFSKVGADLHTLVSAGGVNSVIHGRRHGFVEASTDVEAMLGNSAINTVVIATRHDSHAGFVIKALDAGKHVFVEKPLCLTLEELERIGAVYSEKGWIPDNAHGVSDMTEAEAETAEAIESREAGLPLLMVGFNRRFSPHVKKIKQLLEGTIGPKTFVMTVNAGAIPA
ncbi:MAG: zinc-binding dehydrogenase, partial [Pseudomonadales bacterium]|nr:zinc-binding dehydrogenase [Pseudomonadales bacterium]